MRHKKNTKQFKRTEEERARLWKDLSNALILNGQITTFTARAKWFRPKVERLITLVKRSNGDLKLAYSKVRPYLREEVARKLIEEVAPKYTNRNGGYTRVLKLDMPFSEHDKSIVAFVEADKKEVVKTEIAEVESKPKAKKTTKKETK